MNWDSGSHIFIHRVGCSWVGTPKAQSWVGSFGLTEDLGNSCEGEREAGQLREEAGWELELGSKPASSDLTGSSGV